VGLEGEEALPGGFREVVGFFAEEELHYYADGVGEDVGVEVGEYFALVFVVGFP
jgi:hypothetical protein